MKLSILWAIGVSIISFINTASYINKGEYRKAIEWGIVSGFVSYLMWTV